MAIKKLLHLIKMFRYFSKNTQIIINKFRLLFLSLTISSSIFSESDDCTSITSDKLTVSFDDNLSTFAFSNNVHISTKLFSAQCNNATITANGKLQELDMESGLGSIACIDIDGPFSLQQDKRSCSADSAKITPSDSKITLTGNAKIQDEIGTVSGHEISINYITKSVEISGATQSSQMEVKIPAQDEKSSENFPEKIDSEKSIDNVNDLESCTQSNHDPGLTVKAE